ncbi:hypothetical protein Sphch_1197 [Sphingobium chlorophenolicum L-1]|uniref:Uncharacterized protein n=2 Tax=Sphingobium chlorophenolicum TaxID=46429 RepID=F6EVQ1_SPHCR|nr:hypothetical protein Sphch_1197 [Sphingobium chlorophenolicum L-1]
MRAIATLERAIGRLEQDVDGLSTPSSDSSPGMDRARARAALRSLDNLITELKGQDVKGRVDG